MRRDWTALFLCVMNNAHIFMIEEGSPTSNMSKNTTIIQSSKLIEGSNDNPTKCNDEFIHSIIETSRKLWHTKRIQTKLINQITTRSKKPHILNTSKSKTNPLSSRKAPSWFQIHWTCQPNLLATLRSLKENLRVGVLDFSRSKIEV